MKPLLCIAVVLTFFSGLCLASSAEESATQPALTAAAESIRSELVVHGERVLGKDVYHWSTRLERIDGCRAEFSVRLANNIGGATVNLESVNFALSALEPYAIELDQNHGLKLPCHGRERCIFSTSTCTRTSKDGIVIDCTTPSQKRADAFSVQMDGDSQSAQRLQQALRDAVGACSQPSRVTF